MDKTNINEAVDKHLLDLQEAQRRDDIYNDLNEIVDKLQAMPVFPSLLWVWSFDIIRDIYENYQNAEFNDEVIGVDLTLKKIFDKFWEDVDTLGFSMDQGGEILEECIRDWMRENDFLVALDDDSWLNDLTLEEGSDTMEANQLQKGSEMTHQHYWDKPKETTQGLNIVAECACGEQVEEYQDGAK